MLPFNHHMRRSDRICCYCTSLLGLHLSVRSHTKCYEKFFCYVCGAEYRRWILLATLKMENWNITRLILFTIKFVNFLFWHGIRQCLQCLPYFCNFAYDIDGTNCHLLLVFVLLILLQMYHVVLIKSVLLPAQFCLSSLSSTMLVLQYILRSEF